MRRRYTKVILRVSNTVILSALAVCMCAPVILTLFASFKSGQELEHNLMPILSGSEGPASWKLLPLYPTLRHYVKLLFEMPDFFTVFWNSVKITALILAGQAVVAVPAAWAFAKFNFRGKNVLLMIYIILMLMPFQVTMLPSYLVMDRIGLMNTQASVILPAIFSTLPVFIIYRGFVAIPKELLEAAQVDGAGELAVFVRIGIPLGMPGILSALVLGFLEYWNMMEHRAGGNGVGGVRRRTHSGGVCVFHWTGLSGAGYYCIGNQGIEGGYNEEKKEAGEESLPRI